MKNPLVKKPETNSQNSTNSQKYPETLEEQRDYYLNLYQKWASWQQESPEKLPEGFRTKKEFDFEEILESVKNYDIESVYFFMLVEHDKEMDEIYFNNYFLDENINVSLNYEYGKTEFFEIVKPVIFIAVRGLHEKCEFCEMKGKLNLKCIHSGNKKIIFEDCNFSHITLENFDLRYFSVETIEYLEEMNKQNKLTLINCKKWTELILREKETENEKVFEFEEIIPEEYKDAFAQYFMGFKNFLLKSKGKKVGIEINLNGKLQLKIYSDHQKDIENTEQDFREFIRNIVDIFRTGKVDVIFANKELAQNGNYLMASMINQVNALKADISFIQLEKQNYENLLGIQNNKINLLESTIEIQVNKILNFESTTKTLTTENLDLWNKLDILRSDLRTVKLESLINDDKIDILICLMSEFKLSKTDKDDTSLAKKSVNKISDFIKLNEKWIQCIPVLAKTIQTLKVLIDEFGRNY